MAAETSPNGESKLSPQERVDLLKHAIALLSTAHVKQLTGDPERLQQIRLGPSKDPEATLQSLLEEDIRRAQRLVDIMIFPTGSSWEKASTQAKAIRLQAVPGPDGQKILQVEEIKPADA